PRATAPLPALTRGSVAPAGAGHAPRRAPPAGPTTRPRGRPAGGEHWRAPPPAGPEPSAALPAVGPRVSAPTPRPRALRLPRSTAGRTRPGGPYSRQGAVPRVPFAAARSGWWRGPDRARAGRPPARLPRSPRRPPPLAPSRGSTWRG